MKDKNNKYLIILSFFLGFVITEILFQIIYSNKKEFEYASAEERFMLFDSPNGEVFNIQENFASDSKSAAFLMASTPPACFSNLTIGGKSISITCVQ